MNRFRFMILIIYVFTTSIYSGVTIKLVGTIPIDQSKVFLQNINQFSVTEEEYFLFPDSKAGDIKIYKNDGRLVKVLGRKGFGPMEFVEPYCCDYKDKVFIVLDWGRYKLQSYRRENTDFKPINESFVQALGYGIKYINKNRVLISGYKVASDNKAYELYFLDPEKKKVEYIMLEYLKYGCSSDKEKEEKYLKEIAPISIDGFCDYIDSTIYYIWAGDLKIFKINPVTKSIQYFGKKTSQYVKPVATSELVKKYNTQDKTYAEVIKKMSWITGIFADKDFIAVVYCNYKPKADGWNTVIQFYKPNGNFIEEKEIPGAINISRYPNPYFCYVRETKTLYYLAWLIDPKFEDVYKILKFKILVQ